MWKRLVNIFSHCKDMPARKQFFCRLKVIAVIAWVTILFFTVPSIFTSCTYVKEKNETVIELDCDKSKRFKLDDDTKMKGITQFAVRKQIKRQNEAKWGKMKQNEAKGSKGKQSNECSEWRFLTGLEDTKRCAAGFI